MCRAENISPHLTLPEKVKRGEHWKEDTGNRCRARRQGVPQPRCTVFTISFSNGKLYDCSMLDTFEKTLTCLFLSWVEDDALWPRRADIQDFISGSSAIFKKIQ